MLFLAIGWISLATAVENQTPTLSPISPETDLPFRIRIELADFQLPAGIQSYAAGHYKNQYVFFSGRSNGLHGFDPNPNNFPADEQNTTVFVVDFGKKRVFSRSLKDPGAGLTQYQIDLLSATASQFYQDEDRPTIYLTGGYGIDSATGLFTTFDTLTAIDVKGLIYWVTHPLSKRITAADSIRTITDPIFRVTGGYMTRIGKNPTLLVMGQDFQGTYFFGTHSQEYTQQVRRFHIIDDGKNLAVDIKSAIPVIPEPHLRRRDLNIVPVVSLKKGRPVTSLVALSGVFLPPPQDGAWTVPVEISGKGVSSMSDPSLNTTFKQGINNYISATIGLFSKKTRDMYIILLGGLTLEYFSNGQLIQDDNLPFNNQVATIKIDKRGNYSQYVMSGTFPLIRSTMSHPGNPLYFGTSADFFPIQRLPEYSHEVLKLDQILFSKPVLLGYMVGGIQSTVTETETITDSSASPYIFKVILEPVESSSSSD